MRLLIAGASGRLGSRLVREALLQGHAVTALSRHPETLGIQHADLTIRPVDVRDAAAVEAVLPGHEAVVSALGFKRSGESADVLEVGMRHLTDAMRSHGVRRIMAVAVAGILDGEAGRPRYERPGYPEAFRAGALAHRRVWERLVGSGLEWTLVCPPELVEGDRLTPLLIQADTLPEGPRRVSMEAIAHWMIEELRANSWITARVGACDAGGTLPSGRLE